MSTQKNASDLRRVIRQIVDTRIDLRRPNIRVGRVYSIDLPSQTAWILFPENEVDNLVPVRFALDRIPSEYMDSTFETNGYDAPANVVRIAGKPGAWFILDFVAGAPLSVAINELIFEFNVKWNEETFVASGPGSFFVDLEQTPLAESEKLFWQTLYQSESEWTRSRKSLKISDDDNYLESGDELVYRYAYEDVEFEEVITYEAMPLVGTVSYDDITNALNGSFALPAGVQEGDLITVAASGGSDTVCTDNRLTGGASSGGNKFFYLGYANKVQSPILISLGAGWPTNEFNRSVSISVYRGLIAEEVRVTSGVGSLNSWPFEDAEFGIVLMAANNGTVTGTNVSTTSPGWASRARAWDYKAGSGIFDWFSKEGKTSMPVGTFTYNGTWSSSAIMTIKARPFG